jgi:hypothetical protein
VRAKEIFRLTNSVCDYEMLLCNTA